MKRFNGSMRGTLGFDVDDTLVFDGSVAPHESPLDYMNVTITFDGLQFTLNAYMPHVNAIRRKKETGYAILVWSAGGVNWAEAVVRALNLQDYVDLVMEKPVEYYDDKDANEWMDRKFLK